MSPPGHLLVVEDEVSNAQTLCRVLQRFRVTEIAGSVREATAVLATHQRWTGLVVDIGLPDGSGLDVVAVARRTMPLVPVLVLTGRNDRTVINRAHQLRAEFVCKPATDADLYGFVRRAVAFERVPDERMAWLIEELSQHCELTAKETEVVAAAVANTPRHVLLEQFGVTDNTLKTQVRQVLRKTGFDSLDALTKALLREALSGTGEAVLFDNLEESDPTAG